MKLNNPFGRKTWQSWKELVVGMLIVAAVFSIVSYADSKGYGIIQLIKCVAPR